MKAKAETRAKVKARDIVWGWRRGGSVSKPDPTANLKRMDFHLMFAEAEGDSELVMKLGMEMGWEASYRIGQEMIERVFMDQRIVDPEYEIALTWFEAMMVREARPRIAREAKEKIALRKAIERGRNIQRDPYAN
jgi:hypothetical protein